MGVVLVAGDVPQRVRLGGDQPRRRSPGLLRGRRVTHRVHDATRCGRAVVARAEHLSLFEHVAVGRIDLIERATAQFIGMAGDLIEGRLVGPGLAWNRPAASWTSDCRWPSRRTKSRAPFVGPLIGVRLQDPRHLAATVALVDGDVAQGIRGSRAGTKAVDHEIRGPIQFVKPLTADRRRAQQRRRVRWASLTGGRIDGALHLQAESVRRFWSGWVWSATFPRSRTPKSVRSLPAPVIETMRFDAES